MGNQRRTVSISISNSATEFPFSDANALAYLRKCEYTNSICLGEMEPEDWQSMVEDFKTKWPTYTPETRSGILAVVDYINGSLPIDRYPEVLRHNRTVILEPELVRAVATDVLESVNKTGDRNLLIATLPFLRSIRATEGIPTDSKSYQSLISFRLMEKATEMQVPITIDTIDDVVFNGTLHWDAFRPFLLDTLKVATESDITTEIIQNRWKPIGVTDLDLTGRNIPPGGAIAILGAVKPRGDVALSQIDLSTLTIAQVNSLPDDLQVNGLNLRDTIAPPEVVLALVCKLKPRGDLGLAWVNMSKLTVEQVNTLPDDLQVKGLNIGETKTRPKVVLALIGKLKPRGDLCLWSVSLSDLTFAQVDALPDDLRVNGLDIGLTHTHPAVVLALIGKLKPGGDLGLWSVNMSTLTVAQVNTLPDDLQVNGLDIGLTRTPPAVAMALIGKLKPRGDINLRSVNMSKLTVEQVNTLPDNLQVNGLDIGGTQLSPEVVMALISKLKPRLVRQ